MRKSTLVLAALLLASFFSSGQETLSQQKPERLFQTGLDLLSHRQFGAAYKAFVDFLNVYTTADFRRADAEYFRAFCALTLYHADGEKLLEEFVAGHPLYPKTITGYYDLASFFYSEKNYPRASVYFSKVDFPTLAPDQRNTGRFRYGYSLFSQRKFKEALDQFNAIKSLGGQYGPAASYYAGYIESADGDYPNAMIDLKRAETNTSYATVVPVMITNVYYKQRADAELLRYSEEVLARENVSSADEISLLAAETYFRKQDYKKALALYQEYLEGRKINTDRGVLYRAGFSAFSTGADDQALSYLKQAASDVDSVGVYASYALGLLYLKRQERQYALTAFEITKKFKKDPRLSEESLFLSAKINYELGRADIAIGEFEALIKDYPQSAHAQEVKELLSQAYVNATNYNKAIDYIEALAKRSPAVDKAYQKATFLKGTELYNQEEYAKAVQFFEKSLKFPIDPEYVGEASYWSGESYSVGRKYEQAIPLYQQALGRLTKADLSKKTRYGLGYAYYNLQQYDKALISFREFVNKSSNSDPNYLDGLIRLADCYYIGKSYPEALAAYRKAAELNSPDADYAHLQSGVIQVIQRKYTDAGNEFDLVMRSNSRYADEAVFQRAQMDFELSNYASAVNNFSKLIATSTTSPLLPYAYIRRAAANFNLKKYDQTANDYIAVLEKYPAHPATQDLLLPLQESLNLANRSAEFDKYLAAFKLANPDSKGIESVEFETGKNLYFNQNYAKAIEQLSRFVINYPQSVRIPEAKYYEAESYYRLKDFLKALEIYSQISSDDAFSMQGKVVARVAELEYKQGRYDAAVAAFNKLTRLSTTKKELYTAWNGLMESYFLLAQYDSVDVYANRILEQGNINASAQNKATLFLGKSAMARGDYDTAKDEFLVTLNSARDEYGAEAKYLLGEIFFLTKEYSQCAETLFSLNSDFPNYTDWVGKAYLLLADNFYAMGNSFQAKGTLKSLIDNFPKQDVRDLAKEKLKAIELDELKKKTVEKSDTTGNEK
jgi:tetratricopeptide (TPR) repeat protein